MEHNFQTLLLSLFFRFGGGGSTGATAIVTLASLITIITSTGL